MTYCKKISLEILLFLNALINRTLSCASKISERNVRLFVSKKISKFATVKTKDYPTVNDGSNLFLIPTIGYRFKFQLVIQFFSFTE